MIPRLSALPHDPLPPLVLLAENDEGVLEILSFALKANHFRIAVATNGDEALQRARSEPPDLIIADVHLARRGGLELCDLLRRDAEYADLPVLILSARPTSEARIEALAHGADDFMGKPFSPKELVARVQRLVTRARETTRHRRRNVELERDRDRLETEVRRARAETVRERSLRSLAGGVLDDLLRTLDVDELDARLLRAACRQTGARSAALLVADADGLLVPVAVRGDLPERWADLSLPERGACVHWLCALGRPAWRDELERLSERPGDIARLATHGVTLLAALQVNARLEGVLVCEDRADGKAFDREDRERLAALCAAAAPARSTARRYRAQQDRALELLAATASSDPRRRDAAREALTRLQGAATAIALVPADRDLLARALSLGPWAWGETGRAAIATLVGDDAPRRLRLLRELLLNAEACASGEPGASEDVLALLVAAGLRYQSLRLTGRSAFESWRTAGNWLGVHADPALRASFPEAIEPAGR